MGPTPLKVLAPSLTSDIKRVPLGRALILSLDTRGFLQQDLYKDKDKVKVPAAGVVAGAWAWAEVVAGAWAWAGAGAEVWAEAWAGEVETGAEAVAGAEAEAEHLVVVSSVYLTVVACTFSNEQLSQHLPAGCQIAINPCTLIGISTNFGSGAVHNIYSEFMRATFEFIYQTYVSLSEALARRIEKVCTNCAVWPRRYGYRYCGGNGCNKKGYQI